MANERNAVVTYQGNGSQKAYTFHFDYLQKVFIKIKLINVDEVTELTYGTDYTVSGNEVTLVAATTSVIQIYRETSTERLVAWEDASVLRASDMTLQEVQLLHIAQETMDKVQDGGIALDPTDGVWDARLKKIKNVTNPSEPLDVVNKQYFESTQVGYLQASQAKVDEATAKATIATTEAAEASASASAALTSKNNAATSATNAANSASQAATSATNAANSASQAAEAGASATSAAGSASTATTKASEAATSAASSAANAASSATSANSAKATCESLAGTLQLPIPSLPVDVGKAMSVKSGGGWELKNFAPDGHGLGTYASLFHGDVNTLGVGGTVIATNNASNTPVAGAWLFIQTYGDSVNPSQVAIEMNTSNFFVRSKASGSWLAWKRLTTSDEVLLLSDGTMTGHLQFPNNYGVNGKKTDGMVVPLIKADTNNEVDVGTTLCHTNIFSSVQPSWWNGSTSKLLATTDQLPQVAVLTGTVAHGGTIPLPSGYTQAQCAWMVSPYEIGFNLVGTTTWDTDDKEVCYADADRVVTHIHYNNNTTAIKNLSSNYMIIGVK